MQAPSEEQITALKAELAQVQRLIKEQDARCEMHHLEAQIRQERNKLEKRKAIEFPPEEKCERGGCPNQRSKRVLPFWNGLCDDCDRHSVTAY